MYMIYPKLTAGGDLQAVHQDSKPLRLDEEDAPANTVEPMNLRRSSGKIAHEIAEC